MAAVLLCAALPVMGRERLVRRIGDPDGLPIPRVHRVVQDTAGFVWIGSEAGLVRYDGVEMRPWATDVLHNAVFGIAAGPAGDVFVVDSVSSTVYRVVPSGVEPVPGPGGDPLPAERIVVDAAGRLCAASGEVLRCGAPGAWREWRAAELGGTQISALAPSPPGGLLVAVAGAVWRLHGTNAPERLAEPGVSIAALLSGGGRRFVALQWEGAVWEYDGTRLRRLSENLSRGMSLARRRQTIWAGLARQLVRLAPGEPPEVLDIREGLRDGGDLLADREGSLWLATFNGLLHFPEPDSLTITEREGLPSTHTRYVVPVEEGVWVGTWQGQAFLPRDGSPARTLEMFAVQQLCVDHAGALWTAGCRDRLDCDDSFAVVRRTASRVRRHPAAGGRFRCIAARGGGAWLALGREVLRGDADGSVHGVGTVEIDDVGIRGLLEDSTGTLWAVGGESVCRVPLPGSEPGEWSCEGIPGSAMVHDALEVEPGEIWIGTQDRGALRRGPDAWEPVLDPANLRSRTVTRLARSPRGGAWLLGPGNLLRVARADGRWTRQESLSAWNGVPASSAEDLVEEEDGTIWIATWGGVVRVPSGARGAPVEAPPVALIDVRVDGQRVPASPDLRLPYRRNRIELHFAALSFRDPSRLRYRLRLGPRKPWTESDRPVFRYVDLTPGAYRIEVLASLDGAHWSGSPARFAFRVLPPWYRQTWAMVLFLLLLGGALYAVHRARAAHLVGLERQRVRIAMDLHDEIGSGLGSIGMLAAVAADDGVPDGQRRSIARQIAETAESLGGSLGEIVRSLRPGAARLDALAAHLAERGGRLFPGACPRLSVNYPEPVPRLPISLTVRRNVLLIGSEALHNAARHAGARHVVLGLAPSGRRWRLWVEDDGRGMAGPAAAGEPGLGLASMRRRAEQIDARIDWSAGANGGTRVEMSFPLRSEIRRPRGRLP